jgi:hypothetical protein
MIRLSLFVLALPFLFLDGLSWVLMPGRALVYVLGSPIAGEAGRYAVFFSGVFYATAALCSSVVRRQLLPTPR